MITKCVFEIRFHWCKRVIYRSKYDFFGIYY